MVENSILNHSEVERLIDLALEEDGVRKDLTTLACEVGKNRSSVRATIVAKKETVLCGAPLIAKIFERAQMQDSAKISVMQKEGAFVSANTPWIIFEGKTAALLKLERTILNFLMRMCGIATETKKIVDLLDGTNCKVLHTRKTAPGHRRTDIYAALCGGAYAHRRSLDDAILVKENHLRAVASFQDLMEGIEKFRSQAKFVEIEVTDFNELKHALAAKPNRIMLDNFTVENVQKAVDLFGSSVEFEASGGIGPSNAKAYAQTGVDYISMGYITHSAPGADLSMLFDHA